MLAQIQAVDPKFLHQSVILLLVIISALSSLGGLGVAVYSATRRRPPLAVEQPVEVSGAVATRPLELMVTRTQCDLMHDGIKGEIARVAHEQQQQRDEIDRKLAAIYEKVNALGREVSELTASMRASAIQMSGLVAQIQELQRDRRP